MRNSPQELGPICMSDSDNQRDNLFAEKMLPGDFVFDARVARVFDDMINRSVPGYSTIIAMIGVMAERYCRDNSAIYDLGCSLGGATLAVAHRVSCNNYSLVAIDNSPAMIDSLQNKLLDQDFPNTRIECRCEDIRQSSISNASMVILNFTLQFIAVEQRTELLRRIYEGMNPGGILVISEKILFPDPDLNALMVDLYHSFKENMGYSKLEISQKRAALEKVLLPETLSQHRARLESVGFHTLDVWFQCFNFASMVAFK
jgi:tRNA (cmo5U34)-methyltransferase